MSGCVLHTLGEGVLHMELCDVCSPSVGVLSSSLQIKADKPAAPRLLWGLQFLVPPSGWLVVFFVFYLSWWSFPPSSLCWFIVN